ncbi:hypothetical protein BH11MYX4_BH11MYX4_17690 [soil metagenome]
MVGVMCGIVSKRPKGCGAGAKNLTGAKVRFAKS